MRVAAAGSSLAAEEQDQDTRPLAGRCRWKPVWTGPLPLPVSRLRALDHPPRPPLPSATGAASPRGRPERLSCRRRTWPRAGMPRAGRRPQRHVHGRPSDGAAHDKTRSRPVCPPVLVQQAEIQGRSTTTSARGGRSPTCLAPPSAQSGLITCPAASGAIGWPPHIPEPARWPALFASGGAKLSIRSSVDPGRSWVALSRRIPMRVLSGAA